MVDAMVESINSRLYDIMTNEVLATLEVFDAHALIKLFCGKRVRGKVILSNAEGHVGEFGSSQVASLMKSCGHMKHIAESGFDFDQRLAHRYMRQIKDAVSFGIWKIFCDEWFVYNYNGDLKDKDLPKLVEKPEGCALIDK